jgi:hypothetical protein
LASSPHRAARIPWVIVDIDDKLQTRNKRSREAFDTDRLRTGSGSSPSLGPFL